MPYRELKCDVSIRRKKLISIGTIMLVIVLLLTLASSCGKAEEEGAPSPVVTPTPGVTPTPTTAAKILKIGLLAPFSGAFAQFGVSLIKIVNVDTKALGSVAVEAATMLIYEEDIHYTIGPLITSTLRAMRPLLMEAKAFSAPTSTHMGEAFYSYIMNVCPVDHHLAYHRSF